MSSEQLKIRRRRERRRPPLSRGERDSATQLFVQHNRSMVTVGRNILGDAHTAEDAAQDAWAGSMRQIPTMGTPGPYLRRAASNAAYSILRHWVVGEKYGDRPAFGLPVEVSDRGVIHTDATILKSAEEHVIFSFTLKQVFESIAGLAESQREVMLLSIQGFTVTEIANMLNKPTGTVKPLLFNARKNLRRIFQEKDIFL
jgi:RNA polymerase sigma factor (sigma-70 family)